MPDRPVRRLLAPIAACLMAACTQFSGRADSRDATPSGVDVGIDGSLDVPTSVDVGEPDATTSHWDIVTLDVAPPDAWGGTQITALRNPSCTTYAIFPYQGQETGYIAGHLRMPSTPFLIESIKYSVVGSPTAGGMRCTPTLPHEVILFLGDGAFPNDYPTVLAEIQVPADSRTTTHTVTLTLPTPVAVASPDVFVAIHWAGTFPNVLCVGGCPPGSSGETWTALSSDLPLSWIDFHSPVTGTDANLSVGVVGRAAQ